MARRRAWDTVLRVVTERRRLRVDTELRTLEVAMELRRRLDMELRALDTELPAALLVVMDRQRVATDRLRVQLDLDRRARLDLDRRAVATDHRRTVDSARDPRLRTARLPTVPRAVDSARDPRSRRHHMVYRAVPVDTTLRVAVWEEDSTIRATIKSTQRASLVRMSLLRTTTTCPIRNLPRRHTLKHP